MKEIYKDFLKKYNDVNSESSVEEFLKVGLIHFIIYISLLSVLIIGLAVRQGDVSGLIDGALIIGSLIIAAAYFILTIIPTISLCVRRLKNAGFHWAYLLVFFVPAIGTTLLAIFLILPSKKDREEWGYGWRE